MPFWTHLFHITLIQEELKSEPVIFTILLLISQEKRIKTILAVANFQGFLDQKFTEKNHSSWFFFLFLLMGCFLFVEYSSLNISTTGWVLKWSENSHRLLQKMLMGENEDNNFLIKILWLVGKWTYKPKKGRGKLRYQSKF